MWFYTERQTRQPEEKAKQTDRKVKHDETQVKHTERQTNYADMAMKEETIKAEKAIEKVERVSMNHDKHPGVEHVRNLFGVGQMHMAQPEANRARNSFGYEQAPVVNQPKFDQLGNRFADDTNISGSVLPLMDKQGWWEEK